MAFVGEEKLDAVHPLLAYRVRLLLADPALRGQYGVISGARSYGAQKNLWDRYRAGVGNLAANPAAPITTHLGWPFEWLPTGSFHMVQADGWGHAIDLRRPAHHSRSMARSLVHPLLPTYGLRATVSSEWWHLQALDRDGWVPGPQLPATDLSSQEGDVMKQVNDTNRRRLFTVFTVDGTTTVHEHTDYIEDAGDPMPNASYVIDQQVKLGNIVRAA